MIKKLLTLLFAVTLPFSTMHVRAEEELPQEDNETMETVTAPDQLEEEQQEQPQEQEEQLQVEQPEQPVIDETDPEGSNTLIEEYNQQVDDYNNYVDEHNQQVDDTYEEEYSEYKEELQIVQENNEIVDAVETQIEEDAQILDNVGEPTDWSAEPSEELKTIEVDEAEEKSGETVSVINIHVYLNEDTQYTPDTVYDDVDLETFKLSDELVNSSVLIEYETTEIDLNDTVTTHSESSEFAGNIVNLNGQNKWFGADPKPYFFRSLEGYTQGYWTPGSSVFMSTATNEEYGWSSGGETYTAQYEEQETTQNYLYNGEIMTETVTTRTVDKQEPKNIFSLFTYLFVRLFNEPERMEEPEEPVKGEYLEKLDKMDLLDIPEPQIDPTPEPDPTPTPSPDPDPTPSPSPEPTPEPSPDPTPTPDPEPIITPTPSPDPEPVVTPIPDPDPDIEPEPEIIIPEPEPEPEVAVIPDPIPIPPIIPIITVIAEEEIEETPTPIPSSTPEPELIEDIPEPETPRALIGNWALVNLITTILSVIIALGMLLTSILGKSYEEDEKENDEEEDEGKHKLSKLFGFLPAILSIIIFIMTEDMRLPMVLIDRWTLPMILILIISIILAVLTKNKKQENEEEGN